MKKFIPLFVILFFILLTVPAFAAAAAAKIESPLGDDIGALVGNVTSLIRPVVLISFTGVTIYGGYTRMTAAGNAEKEESAMKILTGGITGFTIVALAPVIVNTVGQLIDLPSVF